MEKNINVKLMGVFASVLLLVIIVTASFAYFGSFDVNLNNNVAVNINAVSPGDATFISSATQLNLQVPAANMSQTASNNEIAAASNTATLTVNLTGAANLLTTCTYDIVYEYDAGSNVYGKSPTTKNGNKEITLQVSNVNGTNNFANEKNFDFDSSWTNNKRTLVSGATIESDGSLTTQNISITGKYYNLTIPQTSIEGKAFTGKIYVTNHSCSTSGPAYKTILANSKVNETTPNFASTSTTNEGLYKADDDYTATTGMKSYYYRGAVDNNWVKFGKYSSDYIIYKGYYSTTSISFKMYDSMNDCTSATSYNVNCEAVKEASKGDDIYWRIIRINGDGSIRMIYTGTTAPTESTKVVMTGEGTQISTSAFNSSKDKAEYVGYQYIEGEQHGYGECNGTSASCTVNENTVYNSAIKQAIDMWYAGTTLETDATTKALVSQDQIFCNDRSPSSTQTAVWTSTGTTYNYGAYGRLNNNKTPILTCPTASDKFTVNTSNGNGALTYPVGLITADEAAMAGGTYGTGNRSYYLYTNQSYWSGSPSEFLSSGCDFEFYVNLNGYSRDDSVNYTRGARPVVSLSSKAKLSGNGTYSKPYTVS